MQDNGYKEGYDNHVAECYREIMSERDSGGELWYTRGNTSQENTHMSYLISLKMKDYFIMASDSYNIKGGEIRRCYKKIFPFPDLSLLIGVTGNTTLRNDFWETREIGECINEEMEKQGQTAETHLQNLCKLVKKAMPKDAVTQMHAAYIKDGLIRYELYTLYRDKYQIESGYGDYHICATGILFPRPEKYRLGANPKEYNIQILKETIHTISHYEELLNEKPRVGGAVQEYVLNLNGIIDNQSEKTPAGQMLL